MKSYIVCAGANGRAVVFGQASKPPVIGQPVTLRNARMVLYWSAECGGLFGLAAHGPKTSSRLTSQVPMTTCVTQQVIECSAEGAEAIAAWPNA